MSQFLDRFRTAYMRNNEAFNRHDFDAAFASMPEDIEWRHFVEAIDEVSMNGRDAVRRYFESILEEFPDWHVEPLEFEEAGDGVAVVHCLATATGSQSGLTLQRPFSQIWELRPDRSVCVREFTDRDEARATAGLR